MQPSVDSYRISAKYYDGAYAAMKDLVDTAFYVELARHSGGPVLEIGCGTGRVLRAIARRGIEIHGVDNSAPMLATLKERLARDARGQHQSSRFMQATCAIFAWAAGFRWSQFHFGPCNICTRLRIKFGR